MYDNVIMCGMSYRLTDAEVADLVTLFGEHPFLAILEDGTPKDRSRRAIRRKKTAAKHRNLEKIADRYQSEDSDKLNLKKRIRMSKEWYADPDLRKDTKRTELREAWEIENYLERRDRFLKLAEAFEEDSDLISEIHVVNHSEVRVTKHFFDDFGVEWDFSDLEEVLPF